jgi:universal stress protein E
MNDSSTILAVIEPDLIPREVVGRAAWLAEKTGCELMLLLCDADVTALAHRFYVSNEAKAIAGNIREAQREILEDLAQPAVERGLSVRTQVLDERPVGDGILQKALEINPRYVLKGTQYHSQAERAIFVDTDWHLIRTCPFPLWLVKPRELAAKPLIVAAVDPSHEQDERAALDSRIIDEAQALAGKSGGELHLLHTCETLTGIGKAATRTFKPIRLPVDELNDRIEKDHRQRLEALAAEKGIDPARAHQLPGAARDVIPYFTREKSADVVVMGALARWSLQRAVIGSTAEKVLDHLPCDILLIRPG